MNQQRGCLLAIGIPLLLLLLFIGGSNLYYHIRMQRYADSMFSMAKQLGYTPQTHLGQGSGCVGPWVTTRGICYFYVKFTMPVDMDQFESQVKALGVPIIADSGFKPNPDLPACSKSRVWDLGKRQQLIGKINFCESVDSERASKVNDPNVQINTVTVSVRLGEVPIWVKLPHDVPVPKEVND